MCSTPDQPYVGEAGGGGATLRGGGPRCALADAAPTPECQRLVLDCPHGDANGGYGMPDDTQDVVGPDRDALYEQAAHQALMQWTLDRVEARIVVTPPLRLFRSTILSALRESDDIDRGAWVLKSDLAEVLAWAEAIDAGQARPGRRWRRMWLRILSVYWRRYMWPVWANPDGADGIQVLQPSRAGRVYFHSASAQQIHGIDWANEVLARTNISLDERAERARPASSARCEWEGARQVLDTYRTPSPTWVYRLQQDDELPPAPAAFEVTIGRPSGEGWHRVSRRKSREPHPPWQV